MKDDESGLGQPPPLPPPLPVAAAPAQETSHGLRSQRAQRYLVDDLRNQREWYSRHASRNKRWSQVLSFIIIACGAATVLMPLFEGHPWSGLVTGALGIAVALSQGSQRIWRFDETWQQYRIASESIKRELRLYVNGAGIYASGADEDVA